MCLPNSLYEVSFLIVRHWHSFPQIERGFQPVKVEIYCTFAPVLNHERHKPVPSIITSSSSLFYSACGKAMDVISLDGSRVLNGISTTVLSWKDFRPHTEAPLYQESRARRFYYGFAIRNYLCTKMDAGKCATVSDLYRHDIASIGTYFPFTSKAMKASHFTQRSPVEASFYNGAQATPSMRRASRFCPQPLILRQGWFLAPLPPANECLSITSIHFIVCWTRQSAEHYGIFILSLVAENYICGRLKSGGICSINIVS